MNKRTVIGENARDISIKKAKKMKNNHVVVVLARI